MQTNESKRKENDVIGATPKGFRDVLPEEAAERERIIQQIKGYFSERGYQPVATSHLFRCRPQPFLDKLNVQIADPL